MEKEKKTGEKKYSYIRKSYAGNGIISLVLAVLSLLLMLGVLWMSVRAGGNSGMTAGALGFSSMVMALMSLWFMRLGFLEPDRDYLFAKIGGIASAVLLLIWICVVAAGLA